MKEDRFLICQSHPHFCKIHDKNFPHCVKKKKIFHLQIYLQHIRDEFRMEIYQHVRSVSLSYDRQVFILTRCSHL